MDAPAPAFDPQLLAQQLAFVRRLARGLAGDADAADELAARTVAAAWVQQPETGVAFRGWLRRVAQRLMRREREAEERRLARERAVARPEATPPADELAAQLELTRRITAALEALDEPFRRTLFERYFLDRTPSAIAEASGVPLATVKSRLQRGLERLRERLDLAHGGRRDGWMAAMVPWIGGPAVVATKTKALPLAVAALVLASGSVALWRPWERTAGENAVVPEAAVSAESGDGGREAKGDRDDAAPTRAVREPLPLAAAASPFAAGVVVDGGGAPLAGVVVVANRLEPTSGSATRWSLAPLDLVELAQTGVQRLALSDAAGRFAVVEPGERLGSLHFVKEGFAAVEFHDLAADVGSRQALHIVLPRQRPIRGVVRDREGRAIAYASVGIGPLFESGVPWITRVARHLPEAPAYVASTTFNGQRGRADGEGRFALLTLPADRFFASASATGYLYESHSDDALGETWEPRLARRDAIFDATDARSGAPLAQVALLVADATTGALLQQGATYDLFEPGGDVPLGRRFLALGIGDRFGYLPTWLDERHGGGPRAVVVHLAATDHVTAQLRLDLDPKREPPHLAVALEPDAEGRRPVAIGGATNRAARLELHLLHADDSPASLELRPPLLARTSAEGGRFAFRDLPRARWLLVAKSEGCAPWSRVVESPVEGLLVDVAPAATLEVAVLDGDGAPVRGARLFVQCEDRSRAWRARSDDDGVARFEALPAGRFDVAAFEVADEVAPRGEEEGKPGRGAVAWPLDTSCFLDRPGPTVVAGETLRFETTLVEAVAVELRVATADGRPAGDARIEEGHALEGPHFTLLDHEVATARLAPRVDADGVARTELWPGVYAFTVRAGGLPQRTEVVVPRGPAVATTITVALPGATGELRGRLVELGSGLPIVQCDVQLWVERPGEGWIEAGATSTERDGRFAFAAVPVGPALVEFHAHSFSSHGRGGREDPESPYPAARQRIAIASATDGEPAAEVVIELPATNRAGSSVATLPLRVEVVDAATGAPLPDARVEVHGLLGDGSLDVELATWTTDARGRVERRLFAAPRYRITAWIPSRATNSALPESKYQTASIAVAPQEGEVVATIALTREP